MKGELKYKEQAQQAVVPVAKTGEKGRGEIDKKNDTLVFLKDRRKKQKDATIITPQKYISRFHYDSKNLDKFIELCPHCRKPTYSSYRGVVADSALNYLEQKLDQRSRRSTRRLFVGLTTGVVLASAGVYYLLVHVLSGVRV
jgi:hypothetical protein